jgi:SAM-dependent methyltransferase
MTDTKRHWETVYTTKGERDVSWFEALPDVSLQMIQEAGVTAESCVLDVGGGDSRLIDALIARGLTCLAVLDVSAVALQRARARLGEDASSVEWIEADIVSSWSLKPMDVWHDRAVFHFLTVPEDRASYRTHLRHTLKVGGTAIIATFALDGPDHCSGLPVARYSPDSLVRELGEDFELIESRPHTHHTPWGLAQSFQYSRLLRTRPAEAGHYAEGWSA